jgi:hypothetical protein
MDIVDRLKDAAQDIGVVWVSHHANRCDAAIATCIEAANEIERLRDGYQRYETARRMNPRQWADAWKLNTTTGKPFDEIIDNMRPFMVPND